MEPLRDPQYILQGGVEGGIPWSLVFSLILLFSGIALLFSVLFINKRNEGKIFGSFKEPYGITTFIKDMKDEVAYKSDINMMCAIYPENYEEPPKKEKKSFSLPWQKKSEEQVNEEQDMENKEIKSEDKDK